MYQENYKKLNKPPTEIFPRAKRSKREIQTFFQMNGLVSLSQRFPVASLSLMKGRGFYFKDRRSFDAPRWFLQTRNSPTLNLNSMSETVLSSYMAIFRIGAFHLPLPRRRRRMKYVLGWRSINQVFSSPSPVLKSVAE